MAKATVASDSEEGFVHHACTTIGDHMTIENVVELDRRLKHDKAFYKAKVKAELKAEAAETQEESRIVTNPNASDSLLHSTSSISTLSSTTTASKLLSNVGKRSPFMAPSVKTRCEKSEEDTRLDFPQKHTYLKNNIDPSHLDINSLEFQSRRVQHAAYRENVSTESVSLGAKHFLRLHATHDRYSRLTLEGYQDQITELLRSVERNDLQPVLDGNYQVPVSEDPVEKHFTQDFSSLSKSKQPISRKRKLLRTSSVTNPPPPPESSAEVNLSVRIQYRSHERYLSLVSSDKEAPLDRQLDKFFQASRILTARDTGPIVCNIAFKEVSYLSALWRDYLNGSLRTALKEFFLAEMFKRSVPVEELDVYVCMDEKAFKKRRNQLVEEIKSPRSCT